MVKKSVAFLGGRGVGRGVRNLLFLGKRGLTYREKRQNFMFHRTSPKRPRLMKKSTWNTERAMSQAVSIAWRVNLFSNIDLKEVHTLFELENALGRRGGKEWKELKNKLANRKYNFYTALLKVRSLPFTQAILLSFLYLDGRATPKLWSIKLYP